MAAILVPLIALGVILAILLPTIWSILRRPAAPVARTDDGDIRFEDEMNRREQKLRNQLDPKPLGPALATDLWQRLMQERQGHGVLYDFHRDYCGHALIRTATGIMLCDSYDGGHNFGDPKATWETGDDFTTFFSRQSDFSMSGWDASEPVFFSDDSWYRNNQRLTRDVLSRYLAGRQD